MTRGHLGHRLKGYCKALVERDHPFLVAVLSLRIARPVAALVLVFGGIAQQRRGASDVGGPCAWERPGGLLFSVESSSLGVERRSPARVVVRADALLAILVPPFLAPLL